MEIKKKDRETWSGKFDFFLSALGYAGKYCLLNLKIIYFISRSYPESLLFR